jgi:hypothetical protein
MEDKERTLSYYRLRFIIFESSQSQNAPKYKESPTRRKRIVIAYDYMIVHYTE